MHCQQTKQTSQACAALSPPSSTHLSFPACVSTTIPPIALTTMLGMLFLGMLMLASLLRPAKLWLRVGVPLSPSSEYVLIARLFGNRCARAAHFGWSCPHHLCSVSSCSAAAYLLCSPPHLLLSFSGAAVCLLMLCSHLRCWGPCCHSAGVHARRFRTKLTRATSGCSCCAAAALCLPCCCALPLISTIAVAPALSTCTWSASCSATSAAQRSSLETNFGFRQCDHIACESPPLALSASKPGTKTEAGASQQQ